MIKKRLTLQLGEVTLAYSVYQKPQVTNTSSIKLLKRIVLLHGAGVAGDLTWSFIAHYLKEWDEILIPDLLGMGDSFFDASDKVPFSIGDICQSLFSLLRHLHWRQFDLVGYSLGGLVALELNKQARVEYDINHEFNFSVTKLCLIEPALFSDAALESIVQFRHTFNPVAESIKANPIADDPFFNFLDLVSPNRVRLQKTDQLAVKRLKMRPFGFANALFAVSNYANTLDESALTCLIADIPEGIGIVGGLSAPGLLAAQYSIKRIQPGWEIEVLPDVDHGLVYVRPKLVAQLINQYLK